MRAKAIAAASEEARKRDELAKRAEEDAKQSAENLKHTPIGS